MSHEEYVKQHEEYMKKMLKDMKHEDKDEVLSFVKIDGRNATYGEVFQMGIDNLLNACENFYELDDANARALAYMCDCAVRWAQAMYHGKEPLLWAHRIDEIGSEEENETAGAE